MIFSKTNLDDVVAKQQMDYDVVEGGTASVGTHMAFTTLMDPEYRVMHDSVWINVTTLIRNTTGALRKELRTVDEIVKRLMIDIEWISTLFEAELAGKECVIYNTTLKYVQTMVPVAELKMPRTNKQRELAALEKKIVVEIMKRELPVRQITGKFGSPGARALILTHQPTDLLSRYGFADVTLLESHTGAMKTLPEWSKKIISASYKEFSHRIPFNRLSLTILGDGNKRLNAKPRSLVKTYIELAIDNRWKPTTTKDKIINDINNMTDRALAHAMLTILK